MKLTLMTRSLLRVLTLAQKIIERKNILPALDNFKFGHDDRGYYVVAGSSEHSLRLALDVTFCDGEFSDFLVPAAELVSVLSTLDAELIYMDVSVEQKGGSVKVDYQTGTFVLPCSKADEYPMPQFSAADMTFNIDYTEVGKAVSTALHYAETATGIRPTMMGVALDVKADGLTVVATNGYLLYKRAFDFGAPFIKQGDPSVLILPAGVVKILEAVFGSAENVEVSSNGQKTMFSSPDAELIVSRIEGRYPNYNSVFPSSSTFSITCPLTELKKSVRRTSLFVSNTADRKLVVEFSKENGLHLKADNIDFGQNCDDKLPDDSFTLSGTVPGTFAIGMKADSLSTVLGDVKSEDVTFHFVDPSRAVVVRESNPESSLQLLLMPMLLNR